MAHLYNIFTKLVSKSYFWFPNLTQVQKIIMDNFFNFIKFLNLRLIVFENNDVSISLPFQLKETIIVLK